MTALLVVASILGAARITHLISDDILMNPFRAWVTRRSLWFGDALSCTYCVGVWVAAACTGWLAWRVPGVSWALWLAAWPAIAYLIVLLEALADFLWKADA